MPYPLANSTWDEEEYEALQTVIKSGMFTMGEKVSQFERAFADHVGSKYCVMVNSGSSANLLMIAALRYRSASPLLPGAEVIVPAVSWSTTYYPLHQYGLKLRFVDIDAQTLNFDLEQLSQAITPDTKAIMAVNLLGNPNDFARIKAIIGDRDIALIEDNCESMGALYEGKQAGTFGLMGSFSSFFSHHISTMEGGLVVTDDEELFHVMLSLRAHGWTRNLPKVNRVTTDKSDDPFTESFRFVLPGYNLRPLEMSGALGLTQLRKLPKIVEERRKNAEKFLELMRDYPFLRVQREIGQSSWFGFSLIVEPDSGVTRENMLHLLTEAQVDVRPIVAGNFAKNEVLKWFDYSVAGDLSNADTADKHGFFIGNHHYPLEQEFELLRSVFGKTNWK
ncbi:GDP-4-keto-6-deoxy-D-mannose-3-dehydratase / pyridoxamine-phosphate transaminase [Ensifer adhaerens]|uniref:DegT/DnrJ/EryC1/StrS family aminotransferase n=1 Tax=Ensifer adhaerens TaxID=106592 RepID=UPI00156810B9|nr:DegT/DnrJ/EryC1/StrS family aminotransferase [Ensifer adhaerens]NRP23187.1 GDP-4-keto-6-deoxy-D-mannose-3-dehydratase / pyridoxamine-phosphate transaminase [Ensifer adhaerens]